MDTFLPKKNLNWLPVTERFNQCISSIAFKYVNNECPNYLNMVFQTAVENNIQTRRSFLKIKMPLQQNQCKPNGAVLNWSNHMNQKP